ncbi:MAG: DUF3667 domain-containing protein [Chthoniobacterales bacterium]
MSEETSEAIFGDAVAAALEKPERRRRGLFGWKKPMEVKPPYTHCEDCGAELHGNYCSNCGQVAVDYRRSFRHFIADVAESFLNWDSKFTKTIGLLLIRPGWLTNQFVAGRRTRYLHPLRLYLLVSILFFLCVRLAPIETNPQIRSEMTPKDRATVEEAMKNPEIPQVVREKVLEGLAKGANSPASKRSVSGISAEIPSPLAARGPGNVSGKRQFDNVSAPSWLKRRVLEKVGPNGSNAQLLSKTLRDNLSTMMLFCIPLFALVLKILYLRQRRFYIEHLVYALHIHSFFYISVLLTVFCSIAAKRWAPALETPLLWIFWLAIVAQVFLSIRQVYRQGWFMTIFKFFLGGVIYLFVLIVALAATAIATIALP